MLVNLGDVAAVTAIFVALVGWLLTWRKAAMNEGKHLEEITQIKKDLNDAWEKIHLLESGGNLTAVALAEIKTTLKFILESVGRLETKLEAHCGGVEVTK